MENKTETTIMGLGFRVQGLGCRPLINKPTPLGRDYNREPNTKARKRRRVINHGSTLSYMHKPCAQWYGILEASTPSRGA